MPSPSADGISELVVDGQTKKCFTHAVVGVLTDDRVDVVDPIGCADKGFDLASLTKVLGTTTVVARLVEKGRLSLDLPLSQLIQALTGDRRAEEYKDFTLREVMGHVVPFVPRVEIFKSVDPASLPKREKLVTQYIEAVLEQGLQSVKGRPVIYSDVGFQLIAFYLENLCGKRLREIFQSEIPEEFRGKLAFGWDPLTAVSTETCPYRGRRLQGEVHDENAYVFGGDCGHAGLFGTLKDVWGLVRAWCRSLEGDTAFLKKKNALAFCTGAPQGDPGPYAFRLGWDSPGTASTALKTWSPETFGHWGFTGTGAWFDPRKNRGLITLTNRVYFGRDGEEYYSWREKIYRL
jgi:CubicO group peptidase (beta-lactamase class C family)